MDIYLRKFPPEESSLQSAPLSLLGVRGGAAKSRDFGVEPKGQIEVELVVRSEIDRRGVFAQPTSRLFEAYLAPHAVRISLESERRGRSDPTDG